MLNNCKRRLEEQWCTHLYFNKDSDGRIDDTTVNAFFDEHIWLLEEFVVNITLCFLSYVVSGLDKCWVQNMCQVSI